MFCFFSALEQNKINFDYLQQLGSREREWTHNKDKGRNDQRRQVDKLQSPYIESEVWIIGEPLFDNGNNETTKEKYKEN